MIDNVNCILEGLSSYPVLDEANLNECLNEWMRTDRNQQWTNDATGLNAILFVQDSTIHTYGDLDNRKKLKKELQNQLNSFLKRRLPQLPLDEYLPKYFRTFSLYAYNYYNMNFEDDYQFQDFNLPLIEKDFEIMGATELFALFYHQDEDESNHIHGLCYSDDCGRDEKYDIMFDILPYMSPLWPEW